MNNTMTPRDNLLRSLRRQGFEWVPVDPGPFCPAQVEAFEKRFGHNDIDGWFETPNRGVVMPVEASYSDGRALFKHEELPDEVFFNSWGIARSRRPDCWHMTHMHHPLQGEDVTADEIRNHPVPRFSAGYQEQMTNHVQEIVAKGFAASGHLSGTVWEGSWYLRSMEDLMSDMMMDDERATLLLDKVTAQSVAQTVAYARAGCDIIHMGDDIGMQHTIMMSLEMWRTWIKPRLKQVINAGRAVKPDVLVFYHSCGYIIPFLEDLIEVGVDILNPIQPECMDFAEIHQLAAGRLSFWGTIGTQSVLPFGTPDEVRAVVEHNLEICGPQGGLVIAPTHMVEPEVPWENLVAMRDAARDYCKNSK